VSLILSWFPIAFLYLSGSLIIKFMLKINFTLIFYQFLKACRRRSDLLVRCAINSDFGSMLAKSMSHAKKSLWSARHRLLWIDCEQLFTFYFYQKFTQKINSICEHKRHWWCLVESLAISSQLINDAHPLTTIFHLVFLLVAIKLFFLIFYNLIYFPLIIYNWLNMVQFLCFSIFFALKFALSSTSRDTTFRPD